MTNHPYQDCIDACQRCATACDVCATSCLQENAGHMAECIRTDIDCAEICRTAAVFMARQSEHAKKICALCAEICQQCGDECRQHEADHCQACARACDECAEQCRKMAA